MTRFAPHPVWWEMIRAGARRVQIYRTSMLFWLISAMLQLFLLRMVWSTIYGDRASVDGVAADTLLVYLTISALHVYVMGNGIAHEMEERISTGQVATDLVRPFGFMHQMVAQQVGFSYGMAPVLLVAVPAGMLVGSLRPPSLPMLLVYLLSFVLAYVVNTLIWMQMGLFGFWMLNFGALLALTSVISSFLSGALVPLWFMPDALRFVVQLLPFQATTFLPASIFSGQVSGSGVVLPMLVQVAWIAILLGTLSLTWRRAQRKLVIQGG